MEPGLWDHVLVALLILAPPLWGRASYARLRQAVAAGAPDVRIAYYRRTILLQWLVAGGVLAGWLWAGRSLRLLGLVPWRGALPAAVGLGAALLGAAFLLGQHRAVLASAEAVASARRQIAPLQDFLPAGPREDAWFARLSVTAGICEELIARGFLIAYLAGWIGTWAAGGVAAAVFGLGHAYQGAGGVVRTTLAGVVAAVVYLGSGWLVPAMVLHAALDLGSGRVVRAIRPA